MPRIDAFLKLGLAQGCSDVHLAVGIPPMLRMNGDLLPIKFRELGDNELEGYVTEILTKTQLERFQQGHDIDFSYVSEDGGRFRVNVFRKETGVGATFPPFRARFRASTGSTCRRSSRSSAIITRG
jgi:twitching motility protein PilT